MRCFPQAAPAAKALLPAVLSSVSLAALLSGCEPTFNWREVRSDTTDLVALLPCKPDRASRPVTLAGQSVELQMMGCDAGGATFAVSHATLADPSTANAVLAQWRAASLANMRAETPKDTAFRPKGSLDLQASVQTAAAGRSADGRPVQAQAAWFASGSQVFHAVVYADKLAPETAEAFFSGLVLPR